MRHSPRTALSAILGILALVLSGCGGSPASSTAAVNITPTVSTPPVEIGYLYPDHYSRMPTAFVDFEPGMVFSATYSPAVEDNSARHSIYKETISYPSGKTTEVEFFVVHSDEEGTDYEASINGQVTQVPDIKEYLTNIEAKMKDKIAFTFYPYPGSSQEPLMKLPPLCAEAAQFEQKYSKLPDKDWLKSLDSFTLQCSSTGKTTSFTLSYQREEATNPVIRSFTVKSDQTGGK